MEPIIELEDVNKTYHLGEVRLQVLKHIDLKIKKGEFAAIIGSSGSGKTTLLNMIGCLDRPTSGKIYIDGKDTSRMTDNELAKIRGRKIGFVFQFFYLIPNLTALENVELPMTFVGTNHNPKKAAELLKAVGLEHRMHHLPSQLSGGEQQRVAIARALINDPDVILADEPTGNLDSKSGEEIIKILSQLHRKGITLLIITHDKSIAKHAKKTVYLKDGVITRDHL